MPTDNEDSGFIHRWSRRKALVREGVRLDEPAAPAAPAPVAAAAVAVPVPMAAPAAADNEVTSPAVAEPPPTLADVAQLGRESDYSRFVGRAVQPDVKNAALAKLFSDPHFNVMDGLDTYIDDYSQPDPLPAGMLRKMLQSQMLGLFDHEGSPAQAALENPQAPAPANALPPTQSASDENTDLQLQPDDGAGRADPGASPVQDAGGSH